MNLFLPISTTKVGPDIEPGLLVISAYQRKLDDAYHTRAVARNDFARAGPLDHNARLDGAASPPTG
jgi:hypothetical protein